jgi:hypothetical protein
MSPLATNPSEADRPKNCFATTHWTVVLAAGTHHDTTRARDALARRRLTAEETSKLKMTI